MRNPADLMIHRPPLLLLDAVLEDVPNGAAASLRVDPGAWYADPQGAMPAWFGLELMAQTIAAYAGLQHERRRESPRQGYLLGTRDYRCTTGVFPPGAELRVEALAHYVDESGLSAFQCRILMDGVPVASALLKTFEEP